VVVEEACQRCLALVGEVEAVAVAGLPKIREEAGVEEAEEAVH
jgi:hypothetical protein